MESTTRKNAQRVSSINTRNTIRLLEVTEPAQALSVPFCLVGFVGLFFFSTLKTINPAIVCGVKTITPEAVQFIVGLPYLPRA